MAVVRSKRLAARTILVLCGMSCALAVLEAGVRIAGIAPALPEQYGDNVRDDAIAFKKRPGSTYRSRSESGEFSVEFAHNSLGFRDGEHALAKPPNTIRIVAVGNSFTYGVGADFADTYLAQVERRLNERPGRHTPVEIVKLGLPRHFPLLERLTLERYGLPFAPDIVLVATFPNDVLNTQQGLASVCAAEAGYLVPCAALGWGEAAVSLYMHSAVARLALQAWSRIRSARVDGAAWSSIFVDNGPYESAWRSMEGELQRIQEDAREHGALFVLVAVPQGPPLRDMHLYQENRLRRWSAAHGAGSFPRSARCAPPARPRRCIGSAMDTAPRRATPSSPLQSSRAWRRRVWCRERTPRRARLRRTGETGNSARPPIRREPR